MKIKHHEIEVNPLDPFVNCKLERREYAKVLTAIVKSYADGFVLAINNEWGTGKTTFVRMWEQHLKNDDYNTIYFNAWENDFDNNPLVAIISELESFTELGNKDNFKSLVKKGAVLTKNVLPALLKAVVKPHIDIEGLADVIEAASKGATEIFTEEIKQYANKKKTIKDFREELEKFIKKIDGNKPLIFIIDELDRCRPDYAVEVLEQMKHFFSVQGIVFVLSIDKEHLASSVRGYYGSEGINTDEYLRRFIDLEYSIPEPSSEVFCNYLFEYYSFGDFFNSEERKEYPALAKEASSLLNVAELLFTKTKTTLRQQEKIFGLTRLILTSFEKNSYTISHVLFVLVYIKIMKHKIYDNIESNSLSLQELSDEFSALFPSNNKDFNLVYVEALLLHLYNNNRPNGKKETLIDKDDTRNEFTPIKSKLASGDKTLLNGFRSILNGRGDFTDAPLKYLITKINLMEPLGT